MKTDTGVARITDTRKANPDTQVGLFIHGAHNTAAGNVVDKRFGRRFQRLAEDSGNTSKDNRDR